MSGRGVLSLEWANDVPGDEGKSRKEVLQEGCSKRARGELIVFGAGQNVFRFAAAKN